jgi:hypothetical protein
MTIEFPSSPFFALRGLAGESRSTALHDVGPHGNIAQKCFLVPEYMITCALCAHKYCFNAAGPASRGNFHPGSYMNGASRLTPPEMHSGEMTTIGMFFKLARAWTCASVIMRFSSLILMA